MPDRNALVEAALTYAELGYAVFPCVRGGKEPLTQHGFRDATTDAAKIEAWWATHPDANVGLATAGLLVVDVDGDKNPWPGARDISPGAVSLTPRGGLHYFYRQPAGNPWGCTAGKLARGVDTRADGGYVVVPPSVVDGTAYCWATTMELQRGPAELPDPPSWLAEELDRLAPRAPQGARVANPEAKRAYSTNEDVERRAAAYVAEMPPAVSGSGGHSATYAAATALVHGFGIPPDRALELLLEHYNPRCQPPWTEKELQHKVEDAAAKPHERPFGWLRNPQPEGDVDLSGILAAAVPREEETISALPDPGPVPDELLRVPGFVSEVMDYCLETAPYPNAVMAFCGALALQAFLAGRKVRDPGDNRTNVYLLGLAHSAAGKDWPRKVSTRIVHDVGLADSLGERFASGEGIQDALFVKPCMLFQTDEIDGILQSINKAKDARHEGIMTTMLTLYSASNSVYPMRRKAGKEWPGAIDQPCLVVFGTAIPNHYYEALSERMLTNGFFARMIILESGPRPTGQEPCIRDLPPRVMAAAKWWADFRPGTGNLESWHPVPAVVEHTDEARRVLIESRMEAEAEYAKAEAKGDAVCTTVWGRVSEQARKLALLYAVSENHQAPRIGLPAVRWATRFVEHQTRRMLFMAQSHVADNPFHAECLKFMEKLRGASGKKLKHSVLLKRMKVDARGFREIVDTLVQRGDVEVITTPRAGAPRVDYRLLDQGGEA